MGMESPQNLSEKNAGEKGRCLKHLCYQEGKTDELVEDIESI